MSILVSILIPIFNEEEYLEALVNRVLIAPVPAEVSLEVIMVDDASTDESPEIAEALVQAHPGRIRFMRHAHNQGKGAAVVSAVNLARGQFCIIQDADLEYDPNEYEKLLRPLLDGYADVVYGSRFLASGHRRVLYFWHSIANKLLTTACNIVSDLNLTDMETGFKAFRTSLIQSIPLRSKRFGIEPEMTIKLAKRRATMYEVAISYKGRTYEQGKKIGVKDAFEALWVILRTSLSSAIYKDAGPEVLDAIASAPKFNTWMADTIRPYIGKHILEIGAGIGNLTTVLVSRKGCYVAADIDPEHLARLRNRFQHRPNLRVGHCDLQVPTDFSPYLGTMDSVVCLNVLEHVSDDALALRNIYSTLKPGGNALILVPHDQRIYGALDEALGHFRRYSREELRTKMEQNGFEVKQMIDFNRVSYPGWFVSGRVMKQRTLRPLQMKIFDRFVGLWRRIDRFLPWGPTSIIAVAQRPLNS